TAVQRYEHCAGDWHPLEPPARWSSAGHPPPVIVLPHGTADFVAVDTGPPLGVGGVAFEAAAFPVPRAVVKSLLPDVPGDDVALLAARTRALTASHVASWTVPGEPSAVPLRKR
ncbi:hypothetical protein VR46_24135, partial [Streptomyces sp. NRRL S-444]